MFKQAITVLLLIIAFTKNANAQFRSLQPALNMSTRTIYDLFVDKAGFLWIAGDLGVSRFDGVNLVNFTSPNQSSLGAKGLCEDQQGKIWFHNFTGQIFYIEFEQMHLLKAYHFDEESEYPRIALFNNNLIATSDKGLFVLNTTSLLGNYIKSSNSATTATNSLAVMKEKVIVNGAGKWYIYDMHGTLRQIPFKSDKTSANDDIELLSPVTANDTAFLQSNPSGTVRKIVIRNDSVQVSGTLKYDSYINTISVENNSQWVNTVKASYSLTTNRKLKNLNISDIVTDNEGNKWVSSIDQGLFVGYNKNPRINTVHIQAVNKADLIITSLKSKSNLLLGTKKGLLLEYNPKIKAVIKTTVFDPKLGPVNYIALTDSTTMLVGFSNIARIFSHGNVIADLPLKFARQALKVDQFTFITSASGLFAIPDNDSDLLKRKFGDLFGNSMAYDKNKKWFYIDRRCRALSYLPKMKALVVAFKAGLFYVSKKGITQIFYEKQPIYASSLYNISNSLYIGTINNGLFVFNGVSIKQISVKQGLLSSTIFKLKPVNNHLWIIGSGPLQLLDLRSLQFINHYDLPSRKDAQVTDVEEIGSTAYLTTLTGLLSYPLNKSIRKQPPLNYLLGVKINNTNISKDNIDILPYSQNNLSLRIGVPSFNYANDIYIKYYLSNGADSTWQVTEPGERLINFPSLAPGEYTFKAIAIDPKADLNGQVVTYKFNISPPWWRRIWVRILVVISLLGLFNYFIISYYLNKISFQRAFYAEQDSVRLERQRISSEIHDDIGSGLFAIHLYADLASKKRQDVKEIGEINTMVSEIADKIREIIWSTNIENDNLENLLYYIQFQITKLFEHSGIKLRTSIPDIIVDAAISSQVRRDIYLVIKELAHNSIKHSEAQNVEVAITIDKHFLTMCIQDDGIGFDQEKVQIDSMGLENIQLRIKRLKGSLIWSIENGTKVLLKIPMQEILTRKFNESIKKWQLMIFDLFKRSHTLQK
jgi:two-component sensor histidine kinase